MKKFFIVGMFCFMLAAFAACGEANSTSEETTQSSAGAENEQKGEDAGSDIEQQDSDEDSEMKENAKAVEDGTEKTTEAKAATPEPATENEEEKNPNVEANQAENTQNDNISATYRDVYKKKIADMSEDGVVYAFPYLDDDDVPELAVIDNGYGTYSIYTMKEDALFCMVDAMSTTEMTYFERSGSIALFASWNGGGDEGGYGLSYYQVSKDKTLTNEEQPVLNVTYNAIYDEEGVYTGEGVTNYYDRGEETDEATFQERLADLRITENSKTIGAEDALSKEEALQFLEQ